MADPKVKIVIEAEDKSKGAFGSAGASVSEFGKTATGAVRDANASLDSLGRAATGAASETEGAMSRAGSALEGFGDKATSAGKALSLGLTAPLVALGALATKAGNELNEGMADVASLSIASDRVIELKDNVKDMQIEFGKSAEDLSGGLYQVISAFGDTTDTVAELDNAIKTGAAGRASTSEALSLISATTKGFNDTTLEAQQHVSDLALKTVELGKTTLPELAGSIGMVTSMSNSLGVSQEELFAGASALSGVIGTTSQVFTGQRAVMQSLMAPTDNMTKLMNALGYANGEQMVKGLGWAKTLQVITTAQKASGAPLQSFIGSIEGQNYAMALTSSQLEKYTSDLDALTNATGKTDAAYKAQTEGVNASGFAMKQAQQMWNVFLEDLNDGLGPALLSFMDLMEPVTTGLLTMGKSFAAMDPTTQKWIVGLAAGAAAIGPLLIGVGKLTSLFGTALPMLTTMAPLLFGLAVPLGLLYGAYRLNIGGLKTFVDNGLNRMKAAAPLAGKAVHELVAQLTGIGVNTYDTTEGIQKFVEALTGSEQAGTRAADMIANLGDKIAAARVSFDQAGGGINGLVAGLGKLTGGSVEISVKSKVTEVDWTTALGDTSYTYDAKADIYSIDWLGKSGATESYTYDAKAGITSIDWNYGTQGSLGFVYDAKAGIQSVDWRAKDLTVQYDAKAGITEVYFFKGLFTGNYTATASVTSVLWGAWTNQYNATAQISDTSVLWGTYTHTYNAKAGIDQASIFWGASTHTYDVSGKVGEASVLWGAYSHTYEAFGKIGETSLAWGAWTHTYDSASDVTKVAWGLLTNTYIAEANISETGVAWGAWTHSYDGTTSITNVAWGLLTHEYAATSSITSVLWGAFSHSYDTGAAVTNVLWGLLTHEYKATSSITSILWGAFSHSYDSGASITKVLWGLFSFKYDSTTGITSVAWGDFTNVYKVTAEVGNVLWGAFTKTYDVTANVVTNIKSTVGNAISNAWDSVTGRATGDSSWKGGPTWVGEKGEELLKFPNGQWGWGGLGGPEVRDLPPGTQIFTHEDSMKMIADGTAPDLSRVGANIGHNAAGTTRPPATMDNAIALATAFGQKLAATSDKTADRAAAKFQKALEKGADRLSSALEGALSKVPGLFSPSQVTSQDMELSKAGLYQNNVDEVLRRVKSAAENPADQGKFAADIEQAKEALNRIGITASDNIKTMSAQFEKAWSDQSLFSNKQNLGLLDQGAIQRSLQLQQQQAQGKANILELYGIQPDQVQIQALQAGQQISAGLLQGTQVDGAALMQKMATSITPASTAGVTGQITSGINANLADPKNTSKIDLNNLVQKATDTDDTALAATGATFLQKITDSWSNAKVDVVSGLASAMNINIGSENATNILHDIGSKIFKIIFQGYDAAASGADYVAPVQSGVNNANKKAGATTTTTTAPAPTAPTTTAPVRGSSANYGRGIALATDAGPNITMNNTFIVQGPIDVQAAAYQIMQEVRRRMQ